MKVLTLWQPWASLVACGTKRIETRRWGTEYRGLVAIHAAKRQVENEVIEAIYTSLQHSTDQQKTLSKKLSEPLPLGQVVAIANLTDCLYMIDPKDPRHTQHRWIDIEAQTPLERAVGNWQHGRYAWIFSDVLKLAHPVDFRGKQRLTALPTEIVELIENTNGFSKGNKS
ncbi:MAG: ASCH domain-containing protein [Timaviella obliquedivisa GSE-PSE-MK23-08B]|jgi:hypothetical protein|nr:ASCH domain-containing protein [Timaviella obliquedivisa GSE-PSE-MK23-08B]